MASTVVQTNGVTETRPPIIPNPPPSTIAANTQLPTAEDPPSQHQATNTNQPHNGNAPAQPPDNPQVQRDENHGDPSDGLWSIYLTEAEKQDSEVTESWKGDTDGILVFTGLFSATVAGFIVESYKKLSPDSSDTTNALLAQISVQLVNISNGIPLAGVAAQSSHPFKPTASAVRVNVLWFLSLVLSMNCALSATLMQQWARRYQELAQRRGAFHRRGRMRAYIFDGISRFGMARAIATMPTLLHTSVFLFFAGLVEFLFPIYTPVAYTTLGCIVVFALAYGVLTILPNIYLNCPYATPLSGFAWGISQFSAIGYLWTILKFECRFPTLWGLTSRHVPEPDVLKRWRETIENQVKTRRQWFSQGMRKSVELCAYTADSTVVTSALEWTLTALDEDKEIEDFAARVPGFFDSRVVPDATLAVLPLMSHRPNANPIFGSRLYDLLKTCISETSTLDDKTRKNRLRVCMKCLWHFGKEYNKLGSSQPLPSYFPDALSSPGIIRRIQAEGDPDVRVMGRCFGALIVNKLAADLESRTGSIGDGELACISTILGTGNRDVESLLYQPGAVALLNTISLTFDKFGGLATGTGPSDVPDAVRQTLDILSQALSSQGNVRLDQPITIIDGSDGTFERILVSRLLDLLNTCTQVISPLPEDVRTSCLCMCLKGLWYFVRAFNQLGSSVPLPSDICIAFANPKFAISIAKSNDLVAREIGRCVGALVVNKLATDVHSRADPIRDVELQCISAVLGGKNSDVTLLLREPGAIELTNTFFLALPNIDTSASTRVPSDVLDMVQQTFFVLSKVLPAELNTAMQLRQANTPMNVSDGASLTGEMYLSVLREWMKNLWHFTREYNERGSSTPLPSSILIAFTNPEMTSRLRKQHDLAVRVIGRCVEALVVNKLAADIKSRRVPVKDDELACLSAILGTKSDDVMLLLSHPGAIEFTNMVFLALDDFDTASAKVPPYVLDVVQQTSSTLSLDLPLELNAKMRLNQANILLIVPDGTSSLAVGVYSSVLRIWMKNLWHFTRGYNERGNSLPLPSYVCIAFTNPEMTRRISEERDLAVHVIGRCVEALVINKLAADINSRELLVSNDELACLSVILGTKSRDVTLLLSCPWTIEFTNMVFLALDDFDSSTPGTVPPYVLDVFQQTSSALSRALPPELNAKMRLNQTDTLMDVPDGTSLTAGIYMSILRGWMKYLWHFAREYNEYGSSVPLPSYVSIAFTNPEMTRRMREERDLAVHVMGRCVEVLVVNKLATDINSRNVLVGNDELACLSAILGTKSDKVIHLLSHPGAIAFTNMVFLALDDFDSASARVPLYVLDAVQQTSSALYQDLPPELNAKMRLEMLLNVPDGTSSLTAEMYTSILRGWVKNLWHFTREYNERGSSVPLPSYVSIAFANPELTRRIREQRGLAVRVMGRCVEVLVVNKLASDIRSRNVLICNDDLACLSAILGTKSDDVMLLLSHPGATAFTNMVFLTLGNLYSFTLGTVPSYVRDLVQQTSSILSQALPPELSAKMRLNLTNSLMYVSDGTSSLTAEMYRRVLHMWMKNLWHFTRDYNRRGNSVPLASYVSIAFTNPEMTRRILGERDPAVHMIGRCVEVLVVNKLATEIKSRNDSDKLACVSTILGTKSDDVMLLLSHPGAIEFTNMIFLALDDIDSSAPGTVPMDMLDVIQQTSSSLSKALPSEMSAKMRLNQAITLIDVSDGITAEMHLTVSRVWMKNLWDFTREYNERGNSPLPSYISVAFTNPEMTHRIRNQRDLAVRVVGRCVGALVVNKLAAYIKSRNVPVSNVELACLSAILSTERDDVLLLLRHPGAIELTNIVLFALANIDTSASTSVPSDALDVILQTFGILSRALPSELNTVMRLDQTGAFIGISNGTTSFTAEMYLTVLRVWMKDLWDFARGYNESGDSAPFPAYVRIAFTNPELTRCIREQRDIAVRVVGRCIGALVVIKLATDIKSRDIPVTDDELACLSAILGTRSDEVIRLLGHPGAIEFTNMVFLALDNFNFFTLGTVPPYVLDIVQRTSGALSRTLPPELNAKMRPSGKNTLMNVSDATSSLTHETYMSVLRERMKNLWHFTREYNERGNSVPLPSYAFVAFGNPELTRRIRKQRDPTVRAIGRCVEALVVNKLAADINSRDIPVTDDELACLSAILGTKNDDVMILLSHPGAIEFTNMVFLTLDDFDSTFGTVPSYVLDVVQQTSSALSHDLPPELKPVMRLRQTNTLMNASDGTSSLTGNLYTNILRRWMKNLWHLTREYNERGNSVPLPTYVFIVFTNPEMTRRVYEQRDLALCVIGRCTEALVVAKLAADIESRDAPVSNDELGGLSAILRTESYDVGLCLSQPGTIQLVNLASLAVGVVSSLPQMPPDTRNVLQQTLTVLSQTIPVRANAELPLDQTITPVDISDNNFEHTILFHIHDLLMMFIPGASSFVEEVRTCCLRMCLKALWHCAKAYHQTSDPLSSYGPLVLAAPEVTRLFQTEQDLVARITGSCFGALIVDKLMNSLESPLSSSGHFRNTEMACISTILGTEHREVLLLPHQLRVINLWNVVSLMSSEADTLSTAAGLSVDVLKLVQDTLDILVNRLRDHLFVSRRLPIDQWQLLQKRYSDVVNALASDQLRKETVKTLNQLRQLLEKLLPGVEESHNTAIPSPSTSH